jgi:hypothetical protein
MQKPFPGESVSQIPHSFDLTVTSLDDENSAGSEAEPYQYDLVCRLAARIPKPLAYGGYLAYHLSLVVMRHKLAVNRSHEELP